MNRAPLPSRERGPVLDVGIGLRTPHIAELLSDHADPQPPVAWLELLADNHFAPGGLIAAQTAAIAERYPLTLHCVGMNIGGTDDLDIAYLDSVRDLMRRTGAAWVSDHLCFTQNQSHHFHDLLPLPYSDEAVNHVAARIAQIQDYLGEPILIENVSAYLRAQAPLTEAEFLDAVVAEAGCGVLLDLNNLYVNQVNLGLDARQALAQIDLDRVQEVHLAGFDRKDGFLVDAHNSRVSEPVWKLYAELMVQRPDLPVLIEWDNDIPPLPTLLDEAARATRLKFEAEPATGAVSA